jgi:hypothetical protein
MGKGVILCLFCGKGAEHKHKKCVQRFIWLDCVMAFERQTMGQRSFRTSPDYEQLEAKIFAHYGVVGGTQKEQYTALLEKLHAKLTLNTDSQDVADIVTDEDIDCVHLVPVRTKKGLELWCEWKRARAPPLSKNCLL